METDRLAKRVINDSLKITKNDNVQIYFNKHTIDLAETLALESQKVGAHADLTLYTDKLQYDLMLERPLEYLEAPDPFNLAALDVATISIALSGIEDPTKLDKITPERWTAISKGNAPYIEKLLKTKQQGASIGLASVTQQRAMTYGIDYKAWKKNAYSAVDVDYKEMQQIGAKLRTALEKAKEIHITNTVGADLSARIEGGQIKVDDGVLNREGSEKTSSDVELPGGSVTIVPAVASVKGAFVSDVALPLFAKLVNGVSWKFEKGMITSFEGKENIELIKDKWLQGTGDKSKFGFIRFGLNPNAKSGYLYNRIIRGAVTVGIGDNRWFGGTHESSVSWAATSVAATVKLDNMTIIDKGKMVL
ncbi:MAG: aminopeptidase [Candidatus Thorarchaeota archaeon]